MEWAGGLTGLALSTDRRLDTGGEVARLNSEGGGSIAMSAVGLSSSKPGGGGAMGGRANSSSKVGGGGLKVN